MDKFATSLIQEQQILQRSNKLKTIRAVVAVTHFSSEQNPLNEALFIIFSELYCFNYQ